MSTRKLAASIAATLSALTLILTLWMAPAQAAFTHKYLSSFGSFSGVGAMSVDDSTGSVYVSDGGNIYKFTSTGEPSEFSATKTNFIEGAGAGINGEGQLAVDNSLGPAKGDIYSANYSNVRIYSATGESLGQLDRNVSSEVPGAPWGGSCGVAVDGEGNVYVGLYEHHVNKYTPLANPATNTSYVASMSGVAPQGFNGVCNVAVDSQGDVYANMWPTGPVIRYDSLQFGAPEAFGTIIPGQARTPFVDLATDDLYVDTGSEVNVFDSANNLKESIKPESGAPSQFGNSWALAVNETTGDVYVSDNEKGRVNVFGPAEVVPDTTTSEPGLTTTTVTLKGVVNPDGLQAGCHFDYGTTTSYGQTVPCSAAPGSGSSPVEVSAEVPGLQPNTVYHARLVGTNANGENAGKDVEFALPFAPTVNEERVLNVGITTATVEAAVVPMGSESTFHVEYGTDTGYGKSVPVPDAEILGRTASQTVSQPIDGLQPGTTYHYRIVATNVNGTTDGPDETFTTFTTPPAEKPDTCPNAALRAGASANLPDCRAYEMVSPVEKNGANVIAHHYASIASSLSGERVEFGTRTGMGETDGSGLGGYSQFIATRGPDGWSSKGIIPTPALNDPLQLFNGGTRVFDLSDEFDRAVLMGYDLPSVTGAPPNTENLYLEDTDDSKVLEPLTRFEGVEEAVIPLLWRWELGGNSSDMSVVAFQMNKNLVPQAKGGSPKVYMLDHGVVRLVSILPDGTLPIEAKLVRQTEGAIAHKDTVSQDGSRIYFAATPEGGERQLYMRKDGSSTVLVSESESSAPSEAQNVNFQAASPDGTKVVFSTSTRLLDADPGGPGVALYLYSDSPNPGSESNLTYITRFTGDEGGAGTEDTVVKGLSDDGTHIYFDSDYNEELPFRTAGLPGLFLWDSGLIKQIAPERGSVGAFANGEEAYVTPDGHQIAFMNRGQLTNHAVLNNSIEIYLYDEEKGTLTCTSCQQTGAAATSGVEHTVEATSPAINPSYFVDQIPRFFSRNGRFVFFNTSEALVPQDTNKLPDAYEYNVSTGKLALLSSGTGEVGTWFVDASPEGQDVFLATRQRLSNWDPDKLDDIYDARIDGGLPEPPVQGPPCDGDACQGTPSAAPSFNTASEFNGLGNPNGTPVVKVKAKSLTRAQLLKRALTVCKKKKAKRKRAACEAGARKRYAAKKPAKRATSFGR